MTNLLSKPNRLCTLCVQLSKSFHNSTKSQSNYKLKVETPANFVLRQSSLLFSKYSYTNFKFNLRPIHTTKPQASIKNQVKVFYFIYNALQYTFIFTMATGIGLMTGYFFTSPDDYENLQPAPPIQYEATRIVS